MKCKNCANYKPKDEAKPKPKTTVTVWRKCLDAKINIAKLHNIYVAPNEEWYRGQYTFVGTPDINRVIRETLDEGALAIKVVCTKDFPFPTTQAIDTVRIWQRAIGDIDGKGWDYSKELFAFRYESMGITDTTIDAAVAEYLAAQKPQDKPTFKVGDIVVRLSQGDACTVTRVTSCGFYILRDCYDSDLGGYSCKELRHTTPDERKAYDDERYTFTLPDGVKIRAYDVVAYDVVDMFPIVIMDSDGDCWHHKRKPGEAICASLVDVNGRKGLPIKKLKQGEAIEFPKGDGK